MINGINRDNSFENTPEGFSVYAKNVVGYDEILNERGTLELEALQTLNVKKYLGEIVFQTKLILFYLNLSDQECIAVYDENTNTATQKVARTDLGFDVNHPIFGEAKLNSKGEIIITYTDRNVSPKYINLDTADPADDVDTYELFLKGQQPKYVNTILDNSGSLKTGAYFITLRYKDKNKSTTDWQVLSDVVYVTLYKDLSPFEANQGSDSGLTSSKAIQINITELDSAFNQYELAVVKSVNETVTAEIIRTVDYVGTTSTVVYTGIEVSKTITIEEIITKNFNFEKIDSITSLTDKLYLGGAYSKADEDLQEFVNTFHQYLRWGSQRIQEPLEGVAGKINKSGNKRTIMHGEVYALYARFKLDGKLTKWFHVPGREPSAADRTVGFEGAKKFIYGDTCTLSASTSTTANGTLGTWENENEVYAPSFPGLAGQKVRHHKTPSLRFMTMNAYSAISTYGIKSWDQLYLYFSGLTVPAQYQGRITDFEIGYAKREEASTTLLGYDIALLMATSTDDSNHAISTGGNWKLDYQGGSGQYDADFPVGKRDSLRLHSPDILVNKPNITDIYLEYIMYFETGEMYGHNSTKSEPWGRIVTGADNNVYSFLSNFYENGGNRSTTYFTASDQYTKLSNTKYLQRAVVYSNDPTKKLDNFKSEECLYGEQAGDMRIFFTGQIETNLDENNHSGTIREPVWLVAIKQLRKDVFTSYLNQKVIAFSKTNAIVGTAMEFTTQDNGDTFICVHSFMTLAHVNTDPSPGEGSKTGIKCFKMFLLESRLNLGQRYEDQADIGTYFFPSGAYRNSTSNSYWFNEIITDATPVNIVKLSRDFYQENIFEVIDIFDHSADYESQFPHLIIASEQASRETGIEDGWRIFRPNNYFYTTRDRGRIVNLEGINNDSLIIHHEYGLFRTRGNVVLKAGLNDISLGKGDIFAIEPSEINSASYGYGGTKHKFSCHLTEIGYLFIDSEIREIFLYDFAKLIPITEGIESDIYDYLDNDELVGTDNPYIGQGISVAYDRENYRILFSLRGTKNLCFSYDLLRKAWKSFHDYLPYKLINTAKNLYSIPENQRLHQHGVGAMGNFYGTVYPSFVDVIINQEPKIEKILNAIAWTSKVIKNNLTVYNETITHVTIWNEYGCTGRIALTEQASSIYDIQDKNLKNYDQTWRFDEIMDVVKNHLSPFISDLYSDYRPISSNLDNDVAWYEKMRLRGKYFIVRLEYSNSEDKEVYLQKLTPDITLSQ